MQVDPSMDNLNINFIHQRMLMIKGVLVSWGRVPKVKFANCGDTILSG
jgi:hypothetical protein